MNFKRNIAGPVIRMSRLYRYFDYVPIDEFREQDIFLVGYPKSGNSWMQHMLTGLLFATTMAEISNRLVRELTPDVHLYPFYKRYRETMCFKSHHLPMPEYRKVIYIVRDGRDAVTSYYHMLRGQGKNAVMGDMVRDGKHLFPAKWHIHVEQWLKNPFGADIHVVRYEDLKSDAAAELGSIADFLKIKRPGSLLRSIADNCSFDSMRKKEESRLWDKHKSWESGKYFVRKGASGDYRNHMSDDLIDYFNRESGDMLRHFGYTADT